MSTAAGPSVPAEREALSLHPSPVAITLTRVGIHAITEQGVIDHILAGLGKGHGGWVITPNLDHLRRCQMDAEFAGHYREANLIVADGMPLIWAAKLQGTPLPERVAGSSLIWTLSAAAADEDRSIFLFGGEPGTAKAAAEVLTRRYPGLRVVGTACPRHGFENDPKQMASLRRQLLEARPDIIFVALGSPKQERLIAQLRRELPQAWWLGVGISFSFVCGKVKRAPRWMQQLGLEWIHRLIQEPRRLARRYLLEDLPFAFHLAVWALTNRVMRLAGAHR